MSRQNPKYEAIMVPRKNPRFQIQDAPRPSILSESSALRHLFTTWSVFCVTKKKKKKIPEPHSQTVLPGEKQEKEPLSRGGLVSGAEVGVDLQCKQQQPETHEENWQDQLVPKRHPQCQQAIHLHHLREGGRKGGREEGRGERETQKWGN